MLILLSSNSSQALALLEVSYDDTATVVLLDDATYLILDSNFCKNIKNFKVLKDSADARGLKDRVSVSMLIDYNDIVCLTESLQPCLSL